MIPLMIDLAGRRVVIFGGGDVAARKAAFFCPEAPVRVVSRSFAPALREMAVDRVEADLSRLADEEIAGHLAGAFLAVAATPDRAINERIGGICSRSGVLFNNAEGERGDVLVPSVVKGEHFLLAISTGGAAPAVPRFLREAIEAGYPHLDGMVALQERMRARLRGTGLSQERRSGLLNAAIRDRELWEALAKGPDQAWEMAERRYIP